MTHTSETLPMASVMTRRRSRGSRSASRSDISATPGCLGPSSWISGEGGSYARIEPRLGLARGRRLPRAWNREDVGEDEGDRDGDDHLWCDDDAVGSHEDRGQQG